MLLIPFFNNNPPELVPLEVPLVRLRLWRQPRSPSSPPRVPSRPFVSFPPLMCWAPSDPKVLFLAFPGPLPRYCFGHDGSARSPVPEGRIGAAGSVAEVQSTFFSFLF